MGYTAVDCQGFAGGMTLGIVQSGFELRGKREMKGGFGVPNCEANRHLLGDSWQSEAVEPEEWTPVDVDLVFGNPPCSGFSLLSRKDFRGPNSPINHCMWALVDYAARCDPQVVAFESVAQAFKQGRELMQALRTRMEQWTGEAWDLYHVLHNAASVGGAAIRRRYFFVIVRAGMRFGVDLDVPRAVPTLRETIGDLRGLGITWERQPYRRPPTWWSKPRRSKAGVDGHQNIDSPAVRRALALLEGTHWDEKEIISTVARRYHQLHGTLPDNWPKETQEKLLRTDFKMGYNQLIRWRGDKVARVITGGGLDLVMHPDEDRLITHREAARIQGFPDDWLIRPLRGAGGLRLTWGKGIPVDCGRWIGLQIRAALDGQPGADTGTEIGERERLIDVTEAYRAVCDER